MSEPARQYQSNDLAGRPTPGPLRDWLAAMKAATAAPTAEPVAAAPRPPSDLVRPPEKVAEPTPAWTPRVVTAPVDDGAEDSDLSDLMAENLMLKAKLRTETGRYDQLEKIIAQELRKLRAHLEDEMGEVTELRAERDRLVERQALSAEEMKNVRARMERDADALADISAERDRLIEYQALSARKFEEVRARMERDADALADMRAERDLWVARAEALAQPLFQNR